MGLCEVVKPTTLPTASDQLGKAAGNSTPNAGVHEASRKKYLTLLKDDP